MGKAVHATPNFDVDVTVVYQFVEVEFVDDFLGNKGEGHLHIFVSFHMCSKIEIVNVKAHVFSTFR